MQQRERGHFLPLVKLSFSFSAHRRRRESVTHDSPMGVDTEVYVFSSTMYMQADQMRQPCTASHVRAHVYEFTKDIYVLSRRGSLFHEIRLAWPIAECVSSFAFFFLFLFFFDAPMYAKTLLPPYRSKFIVKIVPQVFSASNSRPINLEIRISLSDFIFIVLTAHGMRIYMLHIY